jgi:hypothetical protein
MIQATPAGTTQAQPPSALGRSTRYMPSPEELANTRGIEGTSREPNVPISAATGSVSRPRCPTRTRRQPHREIEPVQPRPNPRFHHSDRRFHRLPLMLRRSLASQRSSDGVTRDTQLPGYLPMRQTHTAVKMPNQRPVFQGNHPSNLIGWPTFQTGLVFNRRQHAAPDHEPRQP